MVGGSPGGVCTADSDCRAYGAWNAICYKGICSLDPQTDCAADPQNACPVGTQCMEYTYNEVPGHVCLPTCQSEDFPCLGECDANNVCVPGPNDYCPEGRCSVPNPPVEVPDTPYPEHEWEAPLCGLDTYPCPPYGTTRGRVIDNLVFIAANREAELMAGADGLLSLRDLFVQGPKVIMVFGTAGW